MIFSTWIFTAILWYAVPALAKWIFGVTWDLGVLSLIVCMAAEYVLAGLRVVDQWERVPVMRLGTYIGAVGPGLVWIEPILNKTLDEWDTRDIVNTLKVENIQTHDNIPVSFSLILTQCVAPQDVSTAVLSATGSWEGSKKRATATITECVGNTELDTILHSREDFNSNAISSLQERVREWGITIKSIELQDIKITDETIQEAISMKARAKKEAEAELERAAMQHQVAMKLKEAADVYDEKLWRLKGMETMLELCRSAENNTVLIPTELSHLTSTIGAAYGLLGSGNPAYAMQANLAAPEELK